MHVRPEAQAFPQAPQLCASDVRSTQTPLHAVSPDGHWQTPPAQIWPGAQVFPQVPQFCVVFKLPHAEQTPLAHD
jgi:hypothetical protein